jgi:hypothetical protein
MKVILTIDTEITTPLLPAWRERRLDREYRRDVLGATSQGEYGIGYQAEILKQYGLRATFFVDPFFSLFAGPEKLQKTVRLLQHAGQDVQLHIHTEWLEHVEDSPVGGRTGYNICDFSYDDQLKLLSIAKGMLQTAGVPNVSAFRAGNWGADNTTLRAVREIGISFDASHNGTDPINSRIELGGDHVGTFLRFPNAPFSQCGVLEYPLTIFRDGIRRPRPLHITAAGLREMVYVIESCRRAGWPCVVLVTHSMELITAKRTVPRPIPAVLGRFRGLCRYLSHERDRLEVMTFADLHPNAIREVARDSIRVPFTVTVARLLQQAWRRLS